MMYCCTKVNPKIDKYHFICMLMEDRNNYYIISLRLGKKFRSELMDVLCCCFGKTERETNPQIRSDSVKLQLNHMTTFTTSTPLKNLTESDLI